MRLFIGLIIWDEAYEHDSSPDDAYTLVTATGELRVRSLLLEHLLGCAYDRGLIYQWFITDPGHVDLDDEERVAELLDVAAGSVRAPRIAVFESKLGEFASLMA